jgi:hypothetical protein
MSARIYIVLCTYTKRACSNNLLCTSPGAIAFHAVAGRTRGSALGIKSSTAGKRHHDRSSEHGCNGATSLSVVPFASRVLGGNLTFATRVQRISPEARRQGSPLCCVHMYEAFPGKTSRCNALYNADSCGATVIGSRGKLVGLSGKGCDRDCGGIP